MLLYWIWFAQMSKVSAHMKQKLLQYFRDPEDIYYADEPAFAQISGLTEDGIAELLEKDLTEAQSILDDCKEKGIQLLTYGDRQYPARLRNIYDPPMVLYFAGMLPDWDAVPMIGIVGTRKATVYGLNTAKRFGCQICACGALVVSGGANGIDSMAMEGALEAGGPVIGVLGGGVDVLYPANNRQLFSKVIANGCLISEYPPGVKALPWHFPLRNRIITGMANGLLVVEAPEKSGALISAAHALEQGRDVFVAPGNVDVEACSGSNALLDEAIAALSGFDFYFRSVYKHDSLRSLSKRINRLLTTKQGPYKIGTLSQT
jgi:DNA processing protein